MQRQKKGQVAICALTAFPNESTGGLHCEETDGQMMDERWTGSDQGPQWPMEGRAVQMTPGAQSDLDQAAVMVGNGWDDDG